MAYRQVSPEIKRLIVRNSAVLPEYMVAIILDVSNTTVRHTLDTYEECGDVVHTSESNFQRGRPAILNDDDREVRHCNHGVNQAIGIDLVSQFIEHILGDQNDQYLEEELQDFNFERRGKKKAPNSILSRVLSSMSMTHKPVC
jgi:hypothetical protein